MSYDKQQLKFVMYVGTQTRRFAGQVDGRTIQGTIQGGPSAGQFQLRFVD